MGNFLAFASVTATISYILEEVNRDIAGIRITTKPLDAIDVQNPVNGLNIFLYLVAPNPSIDAIDTLVKDRTGKPTNNPTLLVDLHYLITATSSENDDLTAQKILASAMRILNEHPVLVRELIRKAVRNKEGLESSDLADQVEDVRLSLNALSTEDLTKIWSRFPNANFRASIAYVANVILLESMFMGPSGVVASIALDHIRQLKSPSIERVEPQIKEFDPEARIMIMGNNLKGPYVTVDFDENSYTSLLEAEQIQDNRLVTRLPQDIEPGILKLRVNHYLSRLEKDEIADAKSVLRSNTSAFILAPKITSPRHGKGSKESESIIEFEPPVSDRKAIFVYLGDTSIPAYPIRSTGSADHQKVTSVKFTIPKTIDSGFHLLRIAVDGAMSLIVYDNNPHSSTFKKSLEPYFEVL